MNRGANNPEYRTLAKLSLSLESDYVDTEDPWEGSPFAWIKSRPSRQVGAIGEKLVDAWLTSKGLSVTRSPDSDADRVVENKRVEIKFSTRWKSGGYKFQQLRDQRYDFAICIGISPSHAHCWVLPKKEILHQWRTTGNLASQHGGQAGSDTCWLSVDPSSPPDWLRPFGGTLEEGLAQISSLTGFSLPVSNHKP